MDAKKTKRMRKLSAIALKKNNRGSLSEEALKLILYAVLLLMVIGIIMGAIGDVGTSVKNAQTAGNLIIQKNSKALTKEADPNAVAEASPNELTKTDLQG